MVIMHPLSLLSTLRESCQPSHIFPKLTLWKRNSHSWTLIEANIKKQTPYLIYHIDLRKFRNNFILQTKCILQFKCRNKLLF